MSPRASPIYNLETEYPEVAAQWHPKKNKLKPLHFFPKSQKKVWWICEKGHEYYSSIALKTGGAGCPYCSGRRVGKDNNLAYLNPKLAAEWHPSKNGKLEPEQVTTRSGKKVWWICDRDHEWEAVIANRTNGSGCPECAKKKISEANIKRAIRIKGSLADVSPELASQWHPIKMNH
jgi:hypothetical protein